MKDNDMTNEVLELIDGLKAMLERNEIDDFDFIWNEGVNVLDLTIMVESQKYTAHIDLSIHKSGDRIVWNHK